PVPLATRDRALPSPLFSHAPLLLRLPSPPVPLLFVLSMLRLPPGSTLFPYTTLFRSLHGAAVAVPRARGSRCADRAPGTDPRVGDRKSTRLNSSHVSISYAVFCLKKKRNRQRARSG